MARALLLLAGLCLLAASPALAGCPPAGFDSAANLDLAAFMAAPWYIAAQVPTNKEKVDTLFCSRLEFKPKDASDIARGAVVSHSSRLGSVTGALQDVHASNVSAVQALSGLFPSLVALPAPFNASTDKQATAASKLVLGPGLLEIAYKAGARFLFSNYWVVAAGPAAGVPEWAVLSSGAPTQAVAGSSKCRTGNAIGANAGLWLVTRNPSDAAAAAAALKAADAAGFDTSVLKQVAQAGCSYDSAAAAAATPEAPATTPTSGQRTAEPVADAAAQLLAVTRKAELNITIGGKPAGSITVGLFGNAAPKTVQNFAEICRGSKGFGYKGSKFHRVIKNFMIQGGDFQNGDGTGGFSIYGAKFPDENLSLGLSRGVLAMANAGPDSNGSQFFITVVPTDWLNGKHVVFGRVMRNMDLVDAISDSPTNSADAPLQPVLISSCRTWTDAPKPKPAQ